MSRDPKKKSKTFELKATARPVLKPAVEPTPIEPAAGEAVAAKTDLQKELILRVLEAVKDL